MHVTQSSSQPLTTPAPAARRASCPVPCGAMRAQALEARAGLRLLLRCVPVPVARKSPPRPTCHAPAGPYSTVPASVILRQCFGEPMLPPKPTAPLPMPRQAPTPPPPPLPRASSAPSARPARRAARRARPAPRGTTCRATPLQVGAIWGNDVALELLEARGCASLPE